MKTAPPDTHSLGKSPNTHAHTRTNADIVLVQLTLKKQVFLSCSNEAEEHSKGVSNIWFVGHNWLISVYFNNQSCVQTELFYE